MSINAIKGFFARSDKFDRIDLNLTVDDHADRRCKLDFGAYKIKK